MKQTLTFATVVGHDATSFHSRDQSGIHESDINWDSPSAIQMEFSR